MMQKVYPVYIDPKYYIDSESVIPELLEISRSMWTYLGYTSLASAWHDEQLPDWSKKLLDSKLKPFLYEMSMSDIDWRSYCILSFPLLQHSLWERAPALIRPKGHWSWMRKLRCHAKTAERFDEIADFIQLFMELQIETYGYAKVNTGKAVQRDVSGKSFYLALYHDLADRLFELSSKGVDYKDWLCAKFEKCKAFDKMEFVYLTTIVNRNGFDPDLTSVQQQTDDPWREVKSFLKLSTHCEIPDGSIPKGWTPASVDMRQPAEIVKVLENGFYFYADGEQRRGKFHYAQNTNCIIKCTVDNFSFFKESWHGVRHLRGLPTWAEYSTWGLYPGRWGEDGEPLGSVGIKVKWRRS